MTQDEILETIRAALAVIPPTEAHGWFTLLRLKEISQCSDSVLQKKLRKQAADWEKQSYQGYMYYRRKAVMKGLQ